jgi:3-methylcrotonyl-CoA carboxylase beta subunit
MFMWPNARISVMGGEQAAAVLSTIKRDQMQAKNQLWGEQQERDFQQPILDKYHDQSHPYYASARLWDDGIILPSQTREVVAQCMEISRNASIQQTNFGTFRM